MRNILLFSLCALAAWAQCGRMVYNPATGKLDCTGYTLGGAGTLCLTSTNGAAPIFGACSGSSATAWSALTAPTADLSIANGTWKTAFTGTGAFAFGGKIGVNETTVSSAGSLEVRANSVDAVHGIDLLNSGYVHGSAGTAMIFGHGATSGNTYGLIQVTKDGSNAWGGNLVMNPNGGNVGIGAAAPQQLLTLKSGGVHASEMAAPAPAAALAAGGALTIGTPYYYKVTSLDGAGETVGSAEATAAPVSGNQTINLTWTAIPGATSYKVYRSTTSGTYDATSLAATVTARSFSDNGVTLVSGTVPASTTAYGWKLSPTGSSYLMGGSLGIGAVPRANGEIRGTMGGPTALSSAIADGTLILSNSGGGSGSVGAVMGTTLAYDTYIQSRNMAAVSIPYNLLLQPLGGNVGIGSATPLYAKLVVNGTLQLLSATGVSCDSDHGGAFNYVAGGAGVKDSVSVCAKDAGGLYAWRTIY
jgi:hypothetical protein